MSLALTAAERDSLLESGLILAIAAPLTEEERTMAQKTKTFKTTPGPANGVPYVSPYRQQYRDRPTKPVQPPAPAAPRGSRKEDGLMIVAPVTPRPRAYLDDGERRKVAYQKRKEQGLCAKCGQPGVVKKNGKRSVFCAKHLAASAAYRQRRREGG